MRPFRVILPAACGAALLVSGCDSVAGGDAADPSPEPVAGTPHEVTSDPVTATGAAGGGIPAGRPDEDGSTGSAAPQPADDSSATTDEVTRCGEVQEGQRLEDDLLIREGAECRLQAVSVLGDVRVSEGATLVAEDLMVAGDLVAEGAARVELAKSAVGGDVGLTDGEAVVVEETLVGGRLVTSGHAGGQVLTDSSVEGDLVVEGNDGLVELYANDVEGALSCEGNELWPRGLDNEVEGAASGQCEVFGG